MCRQTCLLPQGPSKVYFRFAYVQSRLLEQKNSALCLFTNAVTSLIGALTLLALLIGAVSHIGTARVSDIVTWPCVVHACVLL